MAARDGAGGALGCTSSVDDLLLCVLVLRARGLASAAPLGAVRCEAHWRGAAARTRGARAAKQGNAAERSWRGEPLRFAAPPSLPAAEPLALLLLNGTRDELLGSAELPASALRTAVEDAALCKGSASAPQEAWLPLRNWARGSRAHGELLVRFWAQPARDAPQPPPASGTVEGGGDASEPSAPDTPATAFARQLARIRAARPVLLAGVATLLDDGRGDGTTAEFVHNLRDWAGDFVGEMADEVTWALTPTALQLFPGATWRCPALAVPLEDVARCRAADGRADRDGVPQALLLLHPRARDADDVAGPGDQDHMRPLRLLLPNARERDALRAALRRAAARLAVAAPEMLRAAPTAATAGRAASPLLLLVDSGDGCTSPPTLTWRPRLGAPLPLGALGTAAGGARLLVDTAAGGAELSISAAALSALRRGGVLRCAAPVSAAPGWDAVAHLVATSRPALLTWRPLRIAAARAAASIALAAVSTAAADAADAADAALHALPPALRAPQLQPLLGTRSAAAFALATHAFAALACLLLLRACAASLAARAWRIQLVSLRLRAAKQPRPQRRRKAQPHYQIAALASPYDEMCRPSLDEDLSAAKSALSGESEAPSSDPGSSDEADDDVADGYGSGGDYGEDDDVDQLDPACFLPDGSLHPLWPRFRSVWGDGAPEGPPVARREAGACLHASAAARFKLCLDWRASTGMDDALTAPQPVFHHMKALYPHALHGRARDGSPLLLERAGRIGALGRGLAAAGVSTGLAVLHLAFLYEFISKRLDARPLPHGRIVRVLDVGGLTFGDVAAATTRAMFSSAAQVLSPFYPERASAVFIVNAPPGFSLAFGLVAPLCARRTLARFKVFGAGPADKQAAARALRALIDAHELPAEYGGACRCGAAEGEPARCWRDHPDEDELWRLAEAATPPQWRLPRPPGEPPLGLGGVPPGAALPPAARREAEAAEAAGQAAEAPQFAS